MAGLGRSVRHPRARSKLLPGGVGGEQGPALVFEAAPWVDGATRSSCWMQTRIACVATRRRRSRTVADGRTPSRPQAGLLAAAAWAKAGSCPSDPGHVGADDARRVQGRAVIVSARATSVLTVNRWLGAGEINSASKRASRRRTSSMTARASLATWRAARRAARRPSAACSRACRRLAQHGGRQGLRLRRVDGSSVPLRLIRRRTSTGCAAGCCCIGPPRCEKKTASRSSSRSSCSRVCTCVRMRARPRPRRHVARQHPSVELVLAHNAQLQGASSRRSRQRRASSCPTAPRSNPSTLREGARRW